MVFCLLLNQVMLTFNLFVSFILHFPLNVLNFAYLLTVLQVVAFTCFYLVSLSLLSYVFRGIGLRTVVFISLEFQTC